MIAEASELIAALEGTRRPLPGAVSNSDAATVYLSILIDGSPAFKARVIQAARDLADGKIT